MKNFICVIILALLGLVFNVETAYAAFPAHAEPAVSVKTERRSFEEFINSTIEKYNLPMPPVGDGASEGNSTLSIISLALGVGGFAAILGGLSAFALSFAGTLLLAGLLLGIGAIITGALGSKRRPLRGLGIAGMVLGIIDLSVLLVAMVFVALLVMMWGK